MRLPAAYVPLCIKTPAPNQATKTNSTNEQSNISPRICKRFDTKHDDHDSYIYRKCSSNANDHSSPNVVSAQRTQKSNNSSRNQSQSNVQREHHRKCDNRLLTRQDPCEVNDCC